MRPPISTTAPKAAAGVSIHKDYTPEERAEGRRRIVETLTQVLIEQGVW